MSVLCPCVQLKVTDVPLSVISLGVRQSTRLSSFCKLILDVGNFLNYVRVLVPFQSWLLLTLPVPADTGTAVATATAAAVITLPPIMLLWETKKCLCYL